MRIKFKDKIYRLKEIESGVDSLMELVEEPKYKHGDFLMTKKNIAFILDREGKCGEAHFLFATDMDGILEDDIQKGGVGTKYCGRLKDALVVNQKATEAIIKGLKKIGKQWNAEKKCIEDVPVYKDGDFVVNDLDAILIFKEADGDRISDHAYLPVYGELVIDRVVSCKGIKRYVTTEEKQRIIDALAERGKRWNEDKKCIENVTVYKKGDILVKEYTENKKFIFILSRIDEDGLMYCDCHYSTLLNKTEVMYDVQVCSIWNNYLRRAEESEKKLLINELIKIGKQWNDDKKCVEDIPKHKFKAGDKVRIKNGVSSKSQGDVYPYFEDFLDQYIGKVMTVKEYVTTCLGEYITTSEAKRGDHHFGFAEDWVELYVEKQQHKFKPGDVVRIKDGVSSDTHRRVSPNFTESMDKFIGKELTVKKYNDFGWVEFYEDGSEYQFHEDWLEPYSEEPKVGDWVIFWDYSPKLAKVGILTGINSDSVYNYRIDEGVHWMYAVKWDGTKEHLEEVRKDKI